MSSLKLEFLTETMEYLRPVVREVRRMEETAEAIIPDRCPDATEILYTEGAVYLRGRELTVGVANVSAGVSASVLVKPDGRMEPEKIEVYIPMSFRVEEEAIQPGMNIDARLQLCRLDSHMVNPRKVLVRATVVLTLCVWESCREEHPKILASGQAELLTGKEPMKLLTAMGEKNYTSEDSIRFTPEGTAKELVSCGVKFRHNDTRLTGTRAVYRGDILLDAMYMDEEGQLRCGSGEIPFSQYVDLGECSESDELRLNTCLTGADIALTADGGGLNCTLQLLTKGEVWANREMEYLKDLYVLKGEAKPEFLGRSYESLLDRQYFSPTGHGSIQLGGMRVVRCCCMPGEVSHTRSGELLEFTLPVSVQVLTEEEGKLRGGSLRASLTFSTQAAPGCRFEVEAEDITASAVMSGDRVDVTVRGTVCLSTFGCSELREIVGAEVEVTESVRNRPSLVIRRMRENEDLWNIAKEYRTTRASIAEANGITEDAAEKGLLLIPLCTG